MDSVLQEVQSTLLAAGFYKKPKRKRYNTTSPCNHIKLRQNLENTGSTELEQIQENTGNQTRRGETE
jgi:hypothetical protein